MEGSRSPMTPERGGSPPHRRPRRRSSSPDERADPPRKESRRKHRHSSGSRRHGRGHRSRSPRHRRSSSSSGDGSGGGGGDEEDGARLHVADLGMGITKGDLKRVYEKFGPIVEIWVAKSPPCFAFIVFSAKDDAEDALKSTDGMTLCGSRVRVSFARPRTRGRGSRGFDPNMRCYQCGDKGHFSRDCPDTRYGYKRPPSRSPSRRGAEGGQASTGRRPRDSSSRRY